MDAATLDSELTGAWAAVGTSGTAAEVIRKHFIHQ